MAFAQQVASVSPEIKTDTLRRLEEARSFRISKPNHGDGGYQKMIQRICNDGPKSSDSMTQERACSSAMMELEDRTSLTLDELMPSFKACSLTVYLQPCLHLVYMLIRFGYPDYALAIMEHAPNCTENCVGAVTIDKSENGISLTIVPRIGISDQKLRTTNSADVVRVLERMCHFYASDWGCKQYADVGGSYTESDRLQAEQNQQNALEHARQDQRDQSARTESRGPGTMNALASALTQVQQQQGATIENANSQQQANLQAMAEAQTPQTQRQSEQHNTNPQQTARITPPLAEINTVTATQNSVVDQPCKNMSGSVAGSARVGPGGFVSGSLTNRSSQVLYVSYTFRQNGIPSTSMANAGAVTIRPGQTIGGEGQGMWSTTADKNPPTIYWYAVLQSDKDAGKLCSHTW